MENTVFAGELYDFLKQHDKHDFYAGLGQEGSINHIQKLLINLYPIRDMIKEVEEISDSLDDHRYYVDEVKPLLCDLREMEKNLEANERRRMVSTTGYEVKCALHVGDKEIIFAEDQEAENGKCYFIGNYGSNELFGEYSECRITDDYLGALKGFTARVDGQIKKMKDEIKRNMPCELFTAEHCYPNDLSQSIDNKIVAIKADVLRPEYRRGEHQLVLVDGGFGNGNFP